MYKKSKIVKIFNKIVMYGLISTFVSILALNAMTVNYLTKEKNIALAQMIPGWGRQYKPIMYDTVKSKSVSFGASWVRDAFDPIISENITGSSFFNHGISGATAYESFRFIQSIIANSDLINAYINIESFYDPLNGQLKKQGFDEKILHIDQNGYKNDFVEIHRFKNLYTSGSSIGYNFQLSKARYLISSGQKIDTISPSYQLIDWNKYERELEQLRIKLFKPSVNKKSDNLTRKPTFNYLLASVGLLCDNDTKVHLYETPHHVFFKGCDEKYAHTTDLIEELNRLPRSCKKNLSYHSFRYPNAITLDAMLDKDQENKFYRPDGHPTPYLGIEILKKLHNLSYDSKPNLEDFGVDLMKMPLNEMKAWVRNRQNRCSGVWEEKDMLILKSDINQLRK